DALYNVMPLNATVTLRQTSSDWDNALELVMVDNKSQLSAVRDEIATDGYTLVNLRASRKWSAVRFDFGVENLFDEAYDLPTGGTYTGQGMTMSINGIPAGIAVPGPARSYYVGINVSF
ncbi:MAG: TonB-dependent receptor, partial [Gammaproteobacteria bacterium]|nr:TonB-dependent receptor [Gammaproteobacteria bacterium]